MIFFELIAPFLIGSMFGSFFYTLAIRYLKGQFKNPIKALISRSRCPHCEIILKPYNLIPIVSYIIGRGRCRHCNKRISPQYLFYEIVFGFLLLLVYQRFGISPYSVLIFFILCFALTITIIDIKEMTIPTPFVLIIIGLSIYPIILQNAYTQNIFGLIFMFSFFSIILLIFPGSFGGGDIKFASSIGLLFGLKYSIVALEVSLISGAVIGSCYALLTQKGFRIKIPFGPFLTIGMIVTALYGDTILLLYESLVLN